jgi:ribosomal protein L37E
MALINCPECGRENVSDTAESCPSCGFGVKAHFEKLRRDEQEKIEEEKRKQEELTRKEREEKLKIELEKERQKKEQEDKEREKIQAQEQLLKQRKKHKRNKKFGIGVLSVFILCIIVSIIYCIIINNRISAVQKSFDKDFSSYIDSLNGNGIKIQGKYKLSKGVYDRESNILKINCFVTYISDDISKYSTADLNSKKAKKLYEILQNVNFAKYYSHYTYKLKDGTSVVVTINDETDCIDKMIIKDSKNNKYMLDTDDSKAYASINGKIIYEQSIKSADESDDTSSDNSDSVSDNNYSDEDETDTKPIQLSKDDYDVHSDGDYWYCDGTVHNVSDYPCYYVKVKVTYYDKNDEVLTTDWAYAVDSEGIDGGENQQFEIMTKVNGNVASYRVDVIDWQQ